MRNIRYIESLKASLEKILNLDDTVIIGEDISEPYGGAFKVTRGLSNKFPQKVINMPMSEQGFTGMAIGMALTGMNVIIEIMFGDFITLVTDQIINHAAKFHGLYEKELHLVIRTPMGGYRGYGPTHSQSLEKLFFGLPDIIVVSPSILGNPGKVLEDSIRTGFPVIFVENKNDYPRYLFSFDSKPFDYQMQTYGEAFPLYELTIDEETELTIITYGGQVDTALELQKQLMLEEEISIKIVNPTKISPLNIDDIYHIIKTDEYILILEEGHVPFGWGDMILSQLYQKGYRGEMRTKGAKTGVIGASIEQEQNILPSKSEIAKMIVEWIGKHGN